MERKLTAAAEAHRKDLEAAKRDAASQLETSRKDAAVRLAGSEEKLRGEMAEMQSRWGRRAGGRPCMQMLLASGRMDPHVGGSHCREIPLLFVRGFSIAQRPLTLLPLYRLELELKDTVERMSKARALEAQASNQQAADLKAQVRALTLGCLCILSPNHPWQPRPNPVPGIINYTPVISPVAALAHPGARSWSGCSFWATGPSSRPTTLPSCDPPSHSPPPRLRS